MKTPICDFVKAYAESGVLRAHMPGHKGVSLTGAEPRDITEVQGADVLYGACGIIRESAENARGGPVFISHADCPEDAALLGEALTAEGAEVALITDVGPVIGSHSGPGTLALFFIGKER